ncbi:MAG: hypothetical protein FJ358_07815 [Thaumarchaeota archaeon]|nr:hypothetical protein [Nitrososphaerota archaeon]
MPRSEDEIRTLVENFEDSYEDEKGIDVASKAFHIFWRDKMMNNAVKQLKELEDLDPIIRLLDYNGKQSYAFSNNDDREALRTRLIQSGSQYGLTYAIDEDNQSLRIQRIFSVARTMITRRDWYTIFLDLKANVDLRNRLERAFSEKDIHSLSTQLQDVHILNSGRTKLTPPQSYAYQCNALPE